MTQPEAAYNHIRYDPGGKDDEGQEGQHPPLPKVPVDGARTSWSSCHVAPVSGSGRSPAGQHQPAVGGPSGRVSLHSRMIWRSAMYQLWSTLMNESR
jgi:hypothetical protein